MKIKKIQLKKGYKRFFDLTIDLGDHPKKIIVLVGPNGCGKSSVLDGMLFQVSAWGNIGNKNAKPRDYHSMNKNVKYEYENVKIDFLEGTYSSVRMEKEKSGKGNTIFSFRSPYRYNSMLKVLDTKAVEEIRRNGYGAGATTDLDDKMEENYRRLYVLYNKYLNEKDCTPSQARQKIIGDLNISIKNCLDLEISSMGSIESSQGTLYFKKPDHPSEFEFDVLSSGEKEVVDILLDLYLRRDEYNDTVFLLDEPELHINTAIQKKLLIEVNKLVGENCQLWIATHSIGFLRALQDDLKDQCQIIQFKDGVPWASTTQVLTPMKSSIGTWREIFEVALDDLAHLVSPKRIIYCEGRDMPASHGRERGLDAQAFNNIFSEKYRDVLFVSSGGNTELEQRRNVAMAILTKVFPTLEIFVLNDRDISSGKHTSENDRLVALKNTPNTNRILKRLEIENYLYDKEVLKEYCSESSLVFDEAAYDSFVKDIENQSVKDETGKIKKACGITTNVNVECFKLNLSRCIREEMAVFRELEDCIFHRK